MKKNQPNIEIPSPILKAFLEIPLLHEFKEQDQFLVYPALQSTFLILENKNHFFINLYHIDLKGTLIKSLNLGTSRYSRLFMANDKTVIIYHYNTLTQWNLSSNQAIKMPLQLEQLKNMFVFPLSKLLIIEQRSNQTEETNKISQNKKKSDNQSQFYLKTTIKIYQIPLNSQEDKPIHTFTISKTDNLLSWQHECMKINNQSKIGWLKEIDFTSEEDYLTLSIYDPLQSKRGVRKYKLSDLFLQNKNLFSAGIEQVWECLPGILYVKCRTWLSYHKCMERPNPICSRKQIEKLLLQQKFMQFIWKYEQNIIYSFGIVPNSFERNIQFSDGLRPLINIKRFYKRTAQNFLQNQYGSKISKILPVFHINALSMSIIGIQNGNMALSEYPKIYYPQNNNTLFLEYNVRKTKKKIDVVLKKASYLTQPLGLYVTFMLVSCIRNCDADLIQYICQLIGESEEQQNYLKQLKWHRIKD